MGRPFVGKGRTLVCITSTHVRSAAVGIYRVHYAGDRGMTRAAAVRRAERAAYRDLVEVQGPPVVHVRRYPIPIVGPRRKFIVTFSDATRLTGEP